MTRSEHNLLDRLPTKHDRPPVATIYACHERLKNEYGWQQFLLYEQWAKTGNGKMIQIPVWAYLSPNQGSAYWTETGAHGFKEHAPVIAMANNIDYIANLATKISSVFIGLLNPGGYSENLRFARNKDGSPTRVSICDFDPVLPRDEWMEKPVPASKYFSTEYAENLFNSLLKILETHPCFYSHHRHEDWESPGKTMVYSDAIRGFNDPVARYFVKKLLEHGFAIRMNRFTWSDEPTQHGVSKMYNRSLDNLLAAGKMFINGQWIEKPAAWSCITTETQSVYKRRHVSLHRRVNFHEEMIRSSRHVIGMMLDQEKAYQRTAQLHEIKLVKAPKL